MKEEGGREKADSWELFHLKNEDPEFNRDIFIFFQSIVNNSKDKDFIIKRIFADNHILKMAEMDIFLSCTSDFVMNLIYREMGKEIFSFFCGDISFDRYFKDSFDGATKGIRVCEGGVISGYLEVILDGRYVSFLHRLWSIGKRSIIPTKKICLVTSIRNEGIYILEWLAYYKAIGVENFFIYSNDNNDGSDSLLEALAQAGEIVWIKNEKVEKSSPQFISFAHALNFLPEIYDYEWALFLDMDEFLAVDGKFDGSIKNFVEWVEWHEVDAIAINWKIVSSSEHMVPSLHNVFLPERNLNLLPYHITGEGSRLVKSMCRPQMYMASYAHDPVAHERSAGKYRLSNGLSHRFKYNPSGFIDSPAVSDYITDRNAVIYHYMYKSFEEWLWKRSRSSGGDIFLKDINIENFSTQFLWEFLAQAREENDFGIAVYTDGIISRAKNELSVLMENKEITKCNQEVFGIYRDFVSKLISYYKITVSSIPEIASALTELKI